MIPGKSIQFSESLFSHLPNGNKTLTFIHHQVIEKAHRNWYIQKYFENINYQEKYQEKFICSWDEENLSSFLI